MLGRNGNRRGMLVMPGEVEWMIQRGPADLTSRSLQVDATSGSLQRSEGMPIMPGASLIAASRRSRGLVRRSCHFRNCHP